MNWTMTEWTSSAPFDFRQEASMFTLWFLACSRIEKIEPDTAVGANVCGEILQPQAGYAALDLQPADPDQLTFGVDPIPYNVRLSWADEPSTTASILWRTAADTFASRVEYGVDTSYGATAIGGSFTFLTGDEAGRVHEVELCDLTPATTYHYRVGGGDYWSPDYSFTTAPVPGTDVPVVIAVAGDSRDNQAVWKAEVAAIIERAPDFVIFSGDAVDFGSNMAEWDAWLDAGAGLIESTAVVLAHGNHEFYAQNYFGLVAQPNDEKTFSLDYGPVHLAVLDDSTTDADRGSQASWLDSDLKGTSQPWKIVSHHMPAYSSCTTRGSELGVRELWSPVEESNGVQIDLTGHNHNYERSVPLNGGLEVPAGDGTVYVVSAGAGADLYGNDMANAFTDVAVVTEHYVIVEIEGESMTLTAYDLGGNIIDTSIIPQ